MEDEVAISLDGKTLNNLRVVDLKQELEKRGLSKSGSKKDLVKRLKVQLDFEKLCEERKSSGDCDIKLELDAETEQNEFVQQYLAQQQKRYAERKEKIHESGEVHSNEDEAKNIEDKVDKSKEHVLTVNADSSSDSNYSENELNTYSGNVKGTILLRHTESVAKTDTHLQSRLSDVYIQKDSNFSILPEKTGVTTDFSFSDESLHNKKEANVHSHISDSLSHEKGIVKSNIHTKLKNAECSFDMHSSNFSRPSSMIKNKTEKVAYVDCDDKKNSEISVNIKHAQLKSEDSSTILNTRNDQSLLKNNFEQSSNNVNKMECTDDMDNQQSNDVCNILRKDKYVIAGSNEEKAVIYRNRNAESGEAMSRTSENLCINLTPDMESATEYPSVPYSLSDIQLPESPENHPPKTKTIPSDQKSDNVDSEDTKLSSSVEIQSNGISQSVSVNSRGNSPDNIIQAAKGKKKADANLNQDLKPSSISHSDKVDTSSETESDSSSSESKHIDNSKDSSFDSNKDSKSAQDESKCDKDLERQRNRKKINKSYSSSEAKKKRHHSSSSSSSQSSDCESHRRHKKRSPERKERRTHFDEVNRSSRGSKENKKYDKMKELPTINNSSKKKLKIKRDNVSVDINSVNLGSENMQSSKDSEGFVAATDSQHDDESSKKVISKVTTEPEIVPKTYVPRKVFLSSRKLSRTSTEEGDNESKCKRSKWGSFASVQKSSQTINISTDSLKNWFPDFKLVTEAAPNIEVEPDEHSTVPVEEKPVAVTHDMSDTMDSISHPEPPHMDVEESESQEPTAEEVGPVSRIIFIQNLVRPFTLNQLKELLKQSGNIVEEKFWIDKIKSKCFVMYESEKEAAKAQTALNNMRWPLSNPKILKVEFSDIEKLEFHRSGGSEAPPKPVPEPFVEPMIEKDTKARHHTEEHKRKTRESHKEREKIRLPVREWDKDKIVQESPDRTYPSKDDKPRSAEKREKKDSKKRPNEDTPAKLLDDLFRKTKSSPCIYWLPLTEEQAREKEEARKLKKQNREKQFQEKEMGDFDRKNRLQRGNRRSREKEIRKSLSRSRSPVVRKQ